VQGCWFNINIIRFKFVFDLSASDILLDSDDININIDGNDIILLYLYGILEMNVFMEFIYYYYGNLLCYLYGIFINIFGNDNILCYLYGNLLCYIFVC